MKIKFLLVVLCFVNILQFSSAAHYVAGIVNDALDGTSSDNRAITLWNPANGLFDNLTDVVGINGNSHADSVYMIDCEMLSTPCVVGDKLRLQVFNTGDNYFSDYQEITVTGAGFDVVPNITINSPPKILSIDVDDSFSNPSNEIDLVANDERNVLCQAIVEEFDGESLQNISFEFFDEDISYFGDGDDNNFHYSNNSCFLNGSYGNENQTQILCNFAVWYYSNSGTWVCQLNLSDLHNSSSTDSDNTFINPLLSIEVGTSLDFGSLSSKEVSNESILNVTNKGNVEINLSLYGYGLLEDDGYAMVCSGGSSQNVPIEYQKYNLVNSIQGVLSLSEFETNYENLTSDFVIKNYNLDYRHDDLIDEATNSTYWRVYVPEGVYGSCQGNIVVGAALGEGI